MGLAIANHIEFAESFAQPHPREILEFAFREYGSRIAISFSGSGSVALIDMASKIFGKGSLDEAAFRVFTLDTGRLHAETYQFIDKVRERYGIPIEVYFPQPEAVEKLVREKGLFSFYRDGHKECCAIRKVEPLQRALSSLDAWITGQRRDQSPWTRNEIPVVQIDPTHSTPEHELVKFNPLANWTSDQIWSYIHENDVPYNALHEKGFISIGCEPCTRPVSPGQHERAGRWWWEDDAKKECGLHAGNIRK
ncbi:MAG: phosphoadenylyl-sulfate reductase [Terriglobia bacterium]